MRPVLAHAAVTAVGVSLATFGSLAASSVIGVMSSLGAYPQALVDYALPAFGGAADRWMIPIAVFGVVVFAGLLLLFRRPQRTAAAVLLALAISVVASLCIALVFAARVGTGLDFFESRRALSGVIFLAAGASGEAFLVGTPMVVIGALLLRSWRARRGLTERPDAL